MKWRVLIESAVKPCPSGRGYKAVAEPEPLYVVAWREWLTRLTSHGSPMPKLLAEQYVAKMNEQFPYIDHWMEEAPPCSST